MKSNRSHEFDHLCKWNAIENLEKSMQQLFEDGIPSHYWPTLFRSNRELQIQKEILDCLKNGYPYAEARLDLGFNLIYIAEYLCMIKATSALKTESILQKKIDYAIAKLQELIPPVRYHLAKFNEQNIKAQFTETIENLVVTQKNRRQNDLLKAASSNDLAKIERCLALKDVDINYVDREGGSALALAMHNANMEAVTCLIEQGATVPQQDCTSDFIGFAHAQGRHELADLIANKLTPVKHGLTI